MKTYIYKITKRKHDTNGNPRSLVTVYRVKKNVPVLLGENVNIDHRSDEQAVCDIIHVAENHPKNYIGALNENPIWKARDNTVWGASTLLKNKVELIQI